VRSVSLILNIVTIFLLVKLCTVLQVASSMWYYLAWLKTQIYQRHFWLLQLTSISRKVLIVWSFSNNRLVFTHGVCGLGLASIVCVTLLSRNVIKVLCIVCRWPSLADWVGFPPSSWYKLTFLCYVLLNTNQSTLVTGGSCRYNIHCVCYTGWWTSQFSLKLIKCRSRYTVRSQYTQ